MEAEKCDAKKLIENDNLKSIIDTIEDKDNMFKFVSPWKFTNSKVNKNDLDLSNFKTEEPNIFNKSIDNKSKCRKKSNLSKSNIFNKKHKCSTLSINEESNYKNMKLKTSHKKLYDQDSLDNKDSSKNATFEIQRLLENLGSHLQASIGMREPEVNLSKSPMSTDSSSTSFWDNPLCQNDLINTKVSNRKEIFEKKTTQLKKGKKSDNIINAELQAICKNIEKNNKYGHISVNVPKSSSTEDESLTSIHNKIPNVRSNVLENKKLNKPLNSPNCNITNIKKSVSNIGDMRDLRFPSNYKVLKLFELNPYDDLIKAHLSPFDRRIKSVAAKNGCLIAIDGPINSFDPLSCQAFRNKIIYQCRVAGPNKENVDKCINYLKETFPNTFLKVNSRNG